MAIGTGEVAPPIDGAPAAAHAVVFYKVTCSVTEMAGPPLAALGRAFPGAVVGVGQDPQEELDRFAARLGWSFPQVPDLPPYEVSDAYRIVSAPTVVVVDETGRVVDVAESWDREAMNGAAASLAALRSTSAPVLSKQGDGLPSFRPG